MMEEDATSTVSKNVAVFSSEISEYSYIYSDAGCDDGGGGPYKRPKLNSTKFKGVVAQPNGSWGAQIYANHQRVWLGTFKSEEEAAMAYDSAAIKLRSGDSHRNFPWSKINVQEPSFKKRYTTDKILNMIKYGSCQPKFNLFRSRTGTGTGQKPQRTAFNDGCVQLFHKELTPSDVGKLNRLVIPKKYAVKFFPYIINGGVDNVEIVFHDRRLRRTWKFRYCYWKSSQSFVFTRGWNRFVKEKRLKEKDVVIFYACGSGSGSHGGAGHTFFLIDATHSLGNGRQIVADQINVGDAEMELELNLGVKKFNCGFMRGPKKVTDDDEVKSRDEGKGGFRLFGVNIPEIIHAQN